MGWRIMRVVDLLAFLFYAVLVCYGLEVWGDVRGAVDWLREDGDAC